MEDNNFVPYEQSLALKELGFDEPCFAFWDAYNGDTHLFFKPRKEYHWLIRLFKSIPSITTYSQGLLEYEEGDNATLAPTYSQGFKWFRENYDFTISIDRKFKGHKRYEVTIDISSYDKLDRYGLDYFHTYEEAELACLVHLIQLVKDK